MHLWRACFFCSFRDMRNGDFKAITLRLSIGFSCLQTDAHQNIVEDHIKRTNEYRMQATIHIQPARPQGIPIKCTIRRTLPDIGGTGAGTVSYSYSRLHCTTYSALDRYALRACRLYMYCSLHAVLICPFDMIFNYVLMCIRLQARETNA
jgi:hypothetical protein